MPLVSFKRDRAPFGQGEQIERRHALLGVEEQEFPVQRHHLDHQRLGTERPIGVVLQRVLPKRRAKGECQRDRDAPDEQLEAPVELPVRPIGALAAASVAQQHDRQRHEHRHDDDEHQRADDAKMRDLCRGDRSRGLKETSGESDPWPGDAWNGCGKQPDNFPRRHVAPYQPMHALPPM